MKNTVKWIIIALSLVGIIVGATLLYNKLGGEYKGNNLIENTPQDNSATDSTAESDNSETQKANDSEKNENSADNSENNKQVNSAPDFTVLDYNGNEVKLSDYCGKPVVLNFWATWCYYCKEEMPDFNEAYKAYPNVQFLMVNATDGVSETTETAKKYIEENGFEFDVFFDTKLDAVNTYYVTGFPQTFFIDANGNLIARGNGMLDLETLKKGIGMITE